MTDHLWEKAWSEEKFKIDTLTPSIIVKRHTDKFAPGDFVLDIGSGNGRNSIYLAKIDCRVDCFDVADLGWTHYLEPNLKKKINFKKNDISKYKFVHKKYKAIVVARVIQYLNESELSILCEKINFSLKSDGFLLMSFNTKGGIFDKKDINVYKHQYTKEEVKNILSKYFRQVVLTSGSKMSRHVNYNSTIKSYDVFATGLKF